MLTVICTVVLLLVALLSVVLRKSYALVPSHELQRQAARDNTLAQRLMLAVDYGLSLPVLLWLVLTLSSAGGFVLLVGVAPGWLSVLVIAAFVWLTFSWLPSSRVSGLSMRLTKSLTPAVAKILQYTNKPLLVIARPFAQHYLHPHSGLYELQDLLNLLDLQSRQPDSRITTEEISLIRQVIGFGDHKVADVMRPRKQIKSVVLTDAIGPVLLDELHASGQTSFPVKETAKGKEIVASLHLADVGIHSTGTVQDYATHGTTYVHSEDSLADALHAFYQTKQQLFVVINSEQDYIGVLTLEDILHTLVGRPSADETLGSHTDAAAVAARH